MASDSVKSVTKNIAVMMFTRVITTSSTLLLMLFLPRHLGPTGYGRLYLGQSIAAIFLLLIEFGGSYSITKAVARDPESTSSIVANAFGIRVILWAASFGLMVLYAALAGYAPDVVLIISIFGVGMFFTSVSAVMGSSYRGRELLKFTAYAGIVETVFVALVGIPCLLMGIGPVTFAVISVSGSFLSMTTLLYNRSALFSALPPVDWKAAAMLLKDGYPYFLNAIFGVIYFRIDTVMLSLMTPDSVVGWYGASYRFFDSLMIIPNIFTISMFPMLARRFGTDPGSFPRLLQKSLDLIVFAAVPMGIGAFIYSPEIIHLFYGTVSYEPSVQLLRIFSIGLPLLYIDFILGTMLIASDMQKQLTRISFFAIAINVSLNVLLIPYFQHLHGNGGVGSALATLATELFVMVNMIVALSGRNFAGANVARQLKALGAGVAMIGVGMWADTFAVPWLAKAFVTGASYLLALRLFNAITAEDMAMTRALLRDTLQKT